MNINKKVKRIIPIVLVLVIACSNIAFGKGVDYEGHWAGYNIKRLIDKGYVKGYEDGSLKPDNEITRAELISLVNRSFGFIAEADITYTDIQESHWAYSEFKKAGAAGYISGFEDGTLRPNNKVTRQELAVIIARLLELEDNPTSDRLLRLYDASKIPTWSKGAVGAMVERVYMHMRDGNIFGATLPATRGEAMFSLDSALSSLVSVVDVTYSEMSTNEENQAITKGTLAFSLSDAPKSIVIDITRTINGKKDQEFKWFGDTIANWDIQSKTYTITGIEPVKATETEQTVLYTVFYSDSELYGGAVGTKSNEIIVKAKK